MIRLPQLDIQLHRDHAVSPGEVYVARCADGLLVVTEMPHRDRDRFAAVLHTEPTGIDGGIDYTVRASTLSSLEAALINATRTAAGANALSAMSIGQSVGRRAA